MVTIEDSEIYGNQASTGGAIYLTTSASAIIKRSVIRDNTATGDGGAIYTSGCSFTVENSIFADNQAAKGGVIRTNSSPTISIVNSTFADNTATTAGGAIWICTSHLDSVILTTIRNSVFWGNTAGDGSGDGNNFY